MFKRIKETFKMLKGLKSMVILKCNNCGSIDTKLLRKTLENDNMQHNDDTFDIICYNIKCNKCDSLGYIEEFWFAKRNKK